jgi:hypothetical protein
MSTTADPMGTLETALAHATRLLPTNPDLAAEQAQEILKAVPGDIPRQACCWAWPGAGSEMFRVRWRC